MSNMPRYWKRTARFCEPHFPVERTGSRYPGDAFFVAFGRATEAVNCAIDVQRTLEAVPGRKASVCGCGWACIPASLSTLTVAIPVWMFTGQRASPRLGMGADFTFRFNAHFSRAGSAGGVSLRDLGKHRLKDIPRPEEIYQLIVPGLPSEFPPLKSAGMLPNNLPTQLSSFIGVKRILKNYEAACLLSDWSPWWGRRCGKTRLSIQWQARNWKHFQMGMVIELAASFRPRCGPSGIEYAEPERASERSPQEVLADFLRPGAPCW